jgi:hypothetical protein
MEDQFDKKNTLAYYSKFFENKFVDVLLYKLHLAVISWRVLRYQTFLTLD